MDTVLYPLVKVCLEVDGYVINTVAGVSDTFPMAVLIGVDVPELPSLLQHSAPSSKVQRSASMRKAEDRRVSRKNEFSGV